MLAKIPGIGIIFKIFIGLETPIHIIYKYISQIE
jgi:hypothetical protein